MLLIFYYFNGLNTINIFILYYNTLTLYYLLICVINTLNYILTYKYIHFLIH
jgi:hypothetical protein